MSPLALLYSRFSDFSLFLIVVCIHTDNAFTEEPLHIFDEGMFVCLMKKKFLENLHIVLSCWIKKRRSFLTFCVF